MIFIIGITLNIIIISFIIYISKLKKYKYEKLIMFFLIPIGIAYLILVPPSQVPDAVSQLYRSYEVSEGVLVGRKDSISRVPRDLQEKLKQVLIEPNENLMIGIPKSIVDMSEYNKNAQKIWKLFYYRYGKEILQLLNREKYANASMTRFYMDYIDKCQAMNRITNIKRIWEEKDIIIVEGEKTLMGVNNDLFENAKSLKRIIVPSTNAYDKFDAILGFIKEMDKKFLYLLAIGPTATVLASDLSKIGYHAVDIGHLDIEYEWALAGSQKKEKIIGKYVNEAGGEGKEKIELPESYYNSIIKKIL